MGKTFLVVMGLLIALTVGTRPASAQPTADIADELDSTGRYLEFSSDPALDDAITDANSNGIAFAWIDQSGGDAIALSETLLGELAARSSRYRTVLVLMNDNVGAWSTVDDGQTEAAINASIAAFGDGAVAGGLTTFTRSLQADRGGATATGDGQSGSSSGSGGGLGLGGLLVPLGLLGGGFFLFRGWNNKRKSDRQIEADLAIDRAEIKEQLRNNADKIIDLGDRVVLSDDRELQDLYEKASVTYQDVSNRIDDATSVAEVDELDDRLDEAEWQLQAIEARLDGKPVPPSPAEVAAAEEAEARKKAEVEASVRRSGPALGRDESVVAGSRPGGYRQRGGYQPRSNYPRRGGMGGGLGGMLGSIILGGIRGGGYSQTRRTRRRGGFPGGGGGLGGGVLRRGGSRRGSGGGGSFGRGRRGSGGGGRF